MKIGLISTIDTNIGDELIRLGIVHVLESLLKSTELDFVVINKHDPMTVYSAWHPARAARRLPRGRRRAENVLSRALSSRSHSRFDDCELIIQCGAPVLWQDCHKCEWAQPLWYGVIQRLPTIPVLNLAAGACYPLGGLPQTLVGSGDERFARDIARMCTTTTVRDALARQLFQSIGTDCPLIPCAALLSSRGRMAPLDPAGPILISYMDGGGHHDFEHNVDHGGWVRVVRQLTERLKRRHEVVFLCHTRAEEQLVESLGTGCRRVRPASANAYFETIASAKGAICNRLHASVALAGAGVPSIAVGTDSRIQMVDEIGIPTMFVNDATSELLEDLIEDSLRRRFEERDRLKLLSEETFAQYCNVVEEVLVARNLTTP